MKFYNRAAAMKPHQQILIKLDPSPLTPLPSPRPPPPDAPQHPAHEPVLCPKPEDSMSLAPSESSSSLFNSSLKIAPATAEAQQGTPVNKA